MELARSVTILGNDVPISELKADVQAAKDKGLSQRWAFCPETVESLIAAVESLTAEKEAAEGEVARIKVESYENLKNAMATVDRIKSVCESDCNEYLKERDTAESSLAQAREELRLEQEEHALCRKNKELQWRRAEAAEQREKGLREALEKIVDNSSEEFAVTAAQAALRTALLDPETIKAEVATERAALAAAPTKGEKTMNEPCEGCNSAPVDCKGLSVCADKWKAKAQYLERYKSVVENQLLPMMAAERTLRLEAEGDCGGDEVAESVEKLLNEARSALAAVSEGE